jgi:hypothetical protein
VYLMVAHAIPVARCADLAAETARAASLVHDALAVRRGIRELPRHDPPLVAGPVA